MFCAIWPIMRRATSCITPRPICATRPVTSMSAETRTCEPPPSFSVTDMFNVACAVPWPRSSEPFASIVAVRASGSLSTIAIVPRYVILTGPSLTVTLAW